MIGHYVKFDSIRETGVLRTSSTCDKCWPTLHVCNSSPIAQLSIILIVYNLKCKGGVQNVKDITLIWSNHKSISFIQQNEIDKNYREKSC